MGKLYARGMDNLNPTCKRERHNASTRRRLDRLELVNILLDQSDEALFLLEVPSGQVVEANRAACELLTCVYDPEDAENSLVGQSLRDVEGLGAEWFDLLLDKPVEDGERSTFLTTIQEKDKLKPVELSVRWARLGEVLYAVVIARVPSLTVRGDVCPQPALDTALCSEQETQIFDSISEHLPCAIVATDLEGRIQQWLGKAPQLFGYSSVEAVGQKLSFICREEARAMMMTRILKGLRRHGRFLGTAPGVCKDGTEQPVEIMAQLAYGQSDEPIAVVGFFRPVSAHSGGEIVSRMPDIEWRAQQHETAAEVSQAALAILSMEDLLPRVVELIRNGFGFDYVGIFLIEDTFYKTDADMHRWATLRAGTGVAGRRMMEMGYRLTVDGDSLVGRCLATGHAQVALTPDDLSELGNFEAPSATALLPRVHSAMALPLISRGRVIGAMLIQSAESGAFSSGDITVLKTMADQLTIAIENARLFDRAQDTLLETRALYYASRVIAEATTIEQIMQGVAKIAASMGFKACLLTLFTNLDASTAILRGDAYGQLVTSEGAKAFPMVKDLIITTRESVRALMLQPDFVVAYGGPGASRMPSDEVVHDFKIYFGLQGGIIVALNLRGRPLGFLAFGGLSGEHSFSLHQVHRVRTIGDRVAVAVDNVRLLASLGEEKARLASLYRLGQVISKSLDVYEVAQQALEEILRTLLNGISGIVVVQETAARRPNAPGYLHLIAAVGRDAEAMQSAAPHLHFRLGEGVVGWVAQERQSLLIPIVANDPRWRPLPGMGLWVQSLVSVPLMSGDELVGVLCVYSDRKASFNKWHRQLVESAAATVAAAIANAKLFGEARRHAWEQSVVSRIVRALNALDMKQAFSALGRGLKELTGCDDATLALLNDHENYLIVTRLLPQLAYEAAQLPLLDAVSRPKSGDAMHIWEHIKRGKFVQIVPSAALSSPDAASLTLSPRDVSEFSQVLYGPDVHSAVSLPLLVSDRVIGMLNLSRAEVTEADLSSFSQQQISILRQIADALAVAVEKHRLFRAEQGKRQEAEILRETALALTTSLDWDEVVNRVIEEIQRAVPYDRASIQLLRDGEKLEIVGGRGFTDLSALLGTCFSVDSDTPHREVIRTRKPFVVQDLQR